MRYPPDRQKMSRSRGRLAATFALAALALALQASAQASPTTFAQFTQAAPGTPFALNNAVSFGQAGIQGSSTQVYFNFTGASGQSTVVHNATLLLQAATSVPATSATLGGNTYLDQSINANNDVLTIIDNNTGKTLLSLTFTGDIVGKQNDTSASLSGSNDPVAGGNTVTYSSQFVNFAPGVNSYLLGLTSISPSLSIGPGGFLNSFTSSITGSFAGTTLAAVPEPVSVAMFSTGILATVILATQRKRLALFRQS